MDLNGLVLLYMNTEILTNGVSFELVAGACCMLNPTSGPIATGSTININSTGAKNIAYTQHSGSSDMFTPSSLEKNIVGLLMYDGTKYHLAQRIAYFDD